VSTSNPYAPPQGEVRDFSASDELELAGRLVRLGAAFVDAIIASLMIYVPALVVLLATGAITGTYEPSAEIDVNIFAIAGLLCLCGFIAWVWITALLVVRNGQTIGKRLLDIRVLRSDGSQASLGRIFWLRNVVNWFLGVIPFYGLVDLLFIFGVRQQCIHDLIADTIVVKA
jgi:uncharacterized RDD family membrane protein YckC